MVKQDNRRVCLCNLCLRSEQSLKPGLETYHSIGTGNCSAAVCFQICEIQTGKKILYHFYQWNFCRRKTKSKVYESHRILRDGICLGVISEPWRTITKGQVLISAFYLNCALLPVLGLSCWFCSLVRLLVNVIDCGHCRWFSHTSWLPPKTFSFMVSRIKIVLCMCQRKRIRRLGLWAHKSCHSDLLLVLRGRHS